MTIPDPYREFQREGRIQSAERAVPTLAVAQSSESSFSLTLADD
jgi:hypothetical protein